MCQCLQVLLYQQLLTLKHNIMEKYIKVVTAEGAQTLSLSNVKLITYDSAGVDT